LDGPQSVTPISPDWTCPGQSYLALNTGTVTAINFTLYAEGDNGFPAIFLDIYDSTGALIYTSSSVTPTPNNGDVFTQSFPVSFLQTAGHKYFVVPQEVVTPMEGSYTFDYGLLVYSNDSPAPPATDDCMTVGCDGAPTEDCTDGSYLFAVEVCSAICGNEIVEPGEDCDGGSCCDSSCNFIAAAASQVCRASAGPCDTQETCSGTSSDCPSDQFVASGSVCRAAAGPCDTQETCSGTSADCPSDQLVASGQVCRPAIGPCDTQETCSGTSSDCPTDVYTHGSFPAGSSCVACYAGTVNPSLSSNMTWCTPCPAGQIAATSGLTSCSNCPAGHYSNGGTSICLNCPAGTSAAAGQSCCTPCGTNTYAGSSSASCSPCTGNTYSLPHASACSNCPNPLDSSLAASICRAH